MSESNGTNGADVMSVEQAADWLGISKSQLYAKVRDGSVPHRKLGKRILFLRKALEQWLSAPPE